jgi:monofunctional biosynthetic peptidoglycan transglycosylase
MRPIRAIGRFIRGSIRTAAVVTLITVMYVGATRVLPTAYTPIMFMRVYEGLLAGEPVGIEKSWVPYEQISPNFFRAFVGAEDARFMRHNGIDWKAMDAAMRYNRAHAGRKVRGASTITMQTAKNVFLWHGRLYIRKGFEAWFTFLIEQLWGKKRILEVYANVVEMGDGIYGVEAASRKYFGKSASDLTRREAALIAAVLPNPRRWSPAAPTPYIKRRTMWIMGRMGGIAVPKPEIVF